MLEIHETDWLPQYIKSQRECGLISHFCLVKSLEQNSNELSVSGICVQVDHDKFEILNKFFSEFFQRFTRVNSTLTPSVKIAIVRQSLLIPVSVTHELTRSISTLPPPPPAPLHLRMECYSPSQGYPQQKRHYDKSFDSKLPVITVGSVQ